MSQEVSHVQTLALKHDQIIVLGAPQEPEVQAWKKKFYGIFQKTNKQKNKKTLLEFLIRSAVK